MLTDLPLHQPNFKSYEYIFNATIGKPEATKLVIEQSGPFSQVACECTQIFHSVNSFLNSQLYKFYNLLMEGFGLRMVELLNLE